MSARIHHVSLVVSDVAVALRFYVGLLGLDVDESRPEMEFSGAWLSLDGQQIHLLQVPNCDPLDGRPSHPGRDRHLALQVENLPAYLQRLEAAGVAFTRSRSGRRAAFVRDPDGNALELIEAPAP